MALHDATANEATTLYDTVTVHTAATHTPHHKYKPRLVHKKDTRAASRCCCHTSHSLVTRQLITR